MVMDLEELQRCPECSTVTGAGDGPLHAGHAAGSVWQKEILWAVVTEGVTERARLEERFQDMGAEEIDRDIDDMVERGYLEEIGGYLRVHPEFAENCYAMIRN
jgi:hypothetical protein